MIRLEIEASWDEEEAKEFDDVTEESEKKQEIIRALLNYGIIVHDVKFTEE